MLKTISESINGLADPHNINLQLLWQQVKESLKEKINYIFLEEIKVLPMESYNCKFLQFHHYINYISNRYTGKIFYFTCSLNFDWLLHKLYCWQTYQYIYCTIWNRTQWKQLFQTDVNIFVWSNSYVWQGRCGLQVKGTEGWEVDLINRAGAAHGQWYGWN